MIRIHSIFMAVLFLLSLHRVALTRLFFLTQRDKQCSNGHSKARVNGKNT